MANTKPPKPFILLVPTAADVAELKIGDRALNAFGNYEEVTEITYRSVDVAGNPFVGYYTRFGSDTSRLSGGYKAGELVRTVHASCRHKSAELDAIERDMRAAGERERVIV